MNESDNKLDYQERKKKLQDFLFHVRQKYEADHKKRVTDNYFAREVLHVPPGNYNSWKLGTRVPEYGTAVMLSLIPEIGGEIFEVLDYVPVYPVSDKILQDIIENWDNPRLENAKAKLYNDWRKEVERDEERGRIPEIKPKS